ncbi:hypothetical protein P152DRAFT_427141 [Eremomyces bilateralis CBS 781.70]|uniref:1-phosphatidylinositol-3-phosphate 5-kinase n=1 Tax=Eremomyces bilateralis CBS 781.70 TaxID=1392243 RepID=A0A6G1GGZ7_9PEZI|nr:uncharacterized protein P152DRAFT_427141 [Eremomyces bilateralis CBS 781.70]KAF1817375.1 hypothetical protein P152DRAFT_427141 [Eremomyces bilateralis CBS 781.70]
MAPSAPRDAPSSRASPRLSPNNRHRRDSSLSTASRPDLDLDRIHTTASRSETLTTFQEFASPPRSSVGVDSKQTAAEAVQGGFSGLYGRLRATVGGARDPSPANVASTAEAASTEEVSTQNQKHRPPPITANLPPSTVLSPPAIESTTTSRIHSPLVSNFVETKPIGDEPSSGHPSLRSLASQKEPGSTKLDRSQSGSRLADAPQRGHGTGRNERLATLRPLDMLNSENIQQHTGLVDTQRGYRTFHQRAGSQPFSDVSGHLTLDSSRGGDGTEESSSRASDIAPSQNSRLETSSSQFAPLPTVGHLSVLANDQSLGFDRVKGASSLLQRELSNRGAPPELPTYQADQTPLDPTASSRPPLIKVSQSNLSGFRLSRAASSDGDFSSVNTVSAAGQPNLRTVEDSAPLDPTTFNIGSKLSQGRRRILDKSYWMRDVNAKDCFNCGDTFSTFRRKHHCRTCGQIFDSKCTSIIDGRPFDYNGNLRVCKPCEAFIHGTDDDSSVYTDEGDPRAPDDKRLRDPEDLVQSSNVGNSNVQHVDRDHTKLATPTLGIPVSRRTNESKRRSAVLEFEGQQTLARPSSSRSLRSLSGRPTSAHKRHQSHHQHMRNHMSTRDTRAPFQRYERDPRQRTALPTFHHDNIIDPDIAPFMSDDGSSDEENPSIFAALNGDTKPGQKPEADRSGISGLIASVRRGKSQRAERSNAALSVTSREYDSSSMSKNPPRHARRRNLSTSSINQPGLSIKKSKSNSLLKGFLAGSPSSPVIGSPGAGFLDGPRPSRSMSIRSLEPPSVELNQASLQHVRKMLKQMLQDSEITNGKAWEKALMPILLQCTDDVSPDVRRNDDIDIRHYIKLKKVLGGKPTDTSYVSGVVFSKNIALKSMRTNISHPRIAIVTFPIEYARAQQHFMSLDPVIAQEREYLRNLVSRIAALNPSLLLVQKNVAGLALKFLDAAKITVIYNVKPTVISAVSRCTQARLITSIDKLYDDPSSLGKCGSFDVKTYVHGRAKKRYVFLSGCQRDLGCTIVLRGESTEGLRRLKRVTEFMCYVVYNLKLETCLMRDEFVAIPTSLAGGTLSPDKGRPSIGPEPSDSETFKSLSTAQGESGQGAVSSLYTDMVEKHKTKILSASPFVQFMQPYLLTRAREQEAQLAYLKLLRDQYRDAGDDERDGTPEEFALVQPEMVHRVVEKPSRQVREFLFAVHAAEYDKALHNYRTQKRQWETYVSGNLDIFDPFTHQRIAVLYSMVNTVTSTPCVGPEIIPLSYYTQHDLDEGFAEDITLGQYVEHLCNDANLTCQISGCDQKLYNHHRQYVHGNGQMSILVQKYLAKIRGLHNAVLMWSCCRICGMETQVIPMSDNTWKYSFAKYLELTFWSTGLKPRSEDCDHDIHRDHVRYFGFNNMALSIQYDKIELYEVIVPRPTINWKVDSDLRLKNELFQKSLARFDRFMQSVCVRIDGIHVEGVVPEKAEECRAELEKLALLADADQQALTKRLQDEYMNSKYYEIVPMNRAIKAMQECAITWDDIFAEFERNFFPSEKDIRRMAALQLRKFFLDTNESTPSIEETESQGIESTSAEKNEGILLTPKPSDLSAEEAEKMLTSVVAEQSPPTPTHVEKDADGLPRTPKKSLSPDRQHYNLGMEEATPRALDPMSSKSVKHLDLAVSAGASNLTPTPGSLLEWEQSSASDSTLRPSGLLPPEVRRPATDTGATGSLSSPERKARPEPLPSLTVPGPPEPLPESKIPRPTSIHAPPLPRTQSTPNHTLAKDAGTIYGGGESSSKISLTEDMRALTQRMSERFNLRHYKNMKYPARSMIPRSVPSEKGNVSSLAKHFEQLSREFEKERQRERRQQTARGRPTRAFPLASSKPIVEVYRNAHEAVRERDVGEDDQISQGRPSTEASTFGSSTLDEITTAEGTQPTTVSHSPTNERDTDSTKDSVTEETSEHRAVHTPSDAELTDAEQTPFDDVEAQESRPSSQVLSPTESQLDVNIELPKHEKLSLVKMLTSFWSERSASGWAPLDYPLRSSEHTWEDSDIIVREDEPSSIIALALSSADYLAKLESFRREPAMDKPSDEEWSERDEDISIERNLLYQKNTNIRYAFQNRNVKAQCKIFYAESFDAIRRKCGVADRFVESLSRCLKWDSKGGKTKSLFLKTLDDRFVLKSLSPIEVNAFFKFAPNYFSFTHQNLFKGLPSVIAKMLGLFQVTIRNTASGTEFNWFMLVMENLFYERQPNRRFDLKGSMRNRKIQSTGEEDEVLLDENLVDIIFEKPIFVRDHTKKLLQASVFNDTLFLGKQNVMDYSLMAGFDDKRREIIVGIIDCIRTYTWDKKLETWIKDRGKNKPTITSPKDYRNRFRIAMASYILEAPNCWHPFHQGMGQRRTVPAVRWEPQKADIEEQEVEGDTDAQALVGGSGAPSLT